MCSESYSTLSVCLPVCLLPRFLPSHATIRPTECTCTRSSTIFDSGGLSFPTFAGSLVVWNSFVALWSCYAVSLGPKVILLPQCTTTKRKCKTMSTLTQLNITSREKMYQALPPLFSGVSKVRCEYGRREGLGPRLLKYIFCPLLADKTKGVLLHCSLTFHSLIHVHIMYACAKHSLIRESCQGLHPFLTQALRLCMSAFVYFF